MATARPKPKQEAVGGHAGAEHVVLPNPTIWPLVTALGILIFWTSFMLPDGPVFVVTGLGVLVLLFGLFSWLFEPLE